MSARDKILGRVRKSLGVTAGDPARIAAVGQRIAQHPATMIPERGAREGEALFAQFKALLEDQQTTVIEVAAPADVPAAVARYVDSLGDAAGRPPAIRMGYDARLAAMPWDDLIGIAVFTGAAEAGDRTGLSHAIAGISETGTLVIAAGRDNPVTLAFMPENHIIVVERSSILGSYEAAIAQVRASFGATAMPRTLNFISGPSRTADIGGRIVIGAHGPRRLAVVVVA
ncbi:MAG: lactate utilization protein C [Hyphomicrobiaceae bacterium]